MRVSVGYSCLCVSVLTLINFLCWVILLFRGIPELLELVAEESERNYDITHFQFTFHNFSPPPPPFFYFFFLSITAQNDIMQCSTIVNSCCCSFTGTSGIQPKCLRSRQRRQGFTKQDSGFFTFGKCTSPSEIPRWKDPAC